MRSRNHQWRWRAREEGTVVSLAADADVRGHGDSDRQGCDGLDKRGGNERGEVVVFVASKRLLVVGCSFC